MHLWARGIIRGCVVRMQIRQAHAPSESQRVREALKKRAAELDRVRLALVVAPGGSGKTTLLRCWRDTLLAKGSTTAWLNLAALLADAATLLEDLVESLRAALNLPEFGEELLRELSHVDPKDAPVLARRVARALRRIDQPIFLFIDNFHLLEAPGTSERLLDLLLRDEDIPLHFAIASRGARPHRTARLLVENQAFAIEAGDLSLRSDQIEQVLRAKDVAADKVLALLLGRACTGPAPCRCTNPTTTVNRW